MHERDLIRETRAALDDLVDLAPKAPKLQSITAGYATLRRVEPPLTRWRPALILVAAAAVTLLVVGIAALIGSNVGDSDGIAGPGTSTTTSEESLQGIWVLSTYTFKGATQVIDEATLAVRGQIPAWIEITSDEITGYTGCNRIESAPGPVLDGDRLVFGEIIVQAGGCIGETSAPALLEALWSGPEGFAVTINSDTMIWTTTAVELTFERRDRRPLAQPGEWPSGFGRLECSPGVSLTQTLPDSGQTLADTLMSIPGVARVEEGEPFSWGIDNSGTVIAGAAYGDIEPRVVQLEACSSTFGVRADADLAGATFTWANNLGLVQTSPFVWGPRIIEICSADEPDLGTLAQRYLDEDSATSIRGDGRLPSLDQAAQTLEIIQRSTCAAERSPTTTAAPPGAQDGVTTTTTTIIPSGGSASCSTTGMEIPADYPPAYEGLPDPVARTWGMLYDAALGCDFVGIINIALESTDSEFSDMIFWGATGTFEGLVRYDADYGSLRSLVLALTTLPAAPFEGQRFDAETQSTVPQDYWSWPPVHDNLGDGVSIADLWDTDTLERVAALNDMTVPELVASIDEFGGYAGFRVGIAEDGSWLFALAGD